MEYKEIKKLMDDMGSSKLTQMEIEFPDGVKIRMKKHEDINTQSVPTILQQTQTKIENTPAITVNHPVEEQKQLPANGKIVKSPMVGTFYAKPSPSAETFVKVGSKVKKGDILCIIEAMKLMNEIESEFDGEVVEIYVKDEEMVEYGKPLMLIQ